MRGGLPDESQELFDVSKMSGTAGIHVLDTALELALIKVDIVPELNDEVPLHYIFRLQFG